MEPLKITSPEGAIQVDISDEKVRKTYIPDSKSPGSQEEKFRREVDVYQYFERHAVNFTPRLLSYDNAACSLEIEKIKGKDLCSILEDGGDIATIEIIGQLVEIDRYLYDHRINYMN